MPDFAHSLEFSLPDSLSEGVKLLIRSATLSDGQAPFSDQALVSAGSRARRILTASQPDGEIVGAVIVGEGELELVVDPAERRQGLGALMLERVLTGSDGAAPLGTEPTSLAVWAHGDHPASRVLLSRAGFEPVRTLLQLRMPLAGSPAEQATASAFAIRAFRRGQDESAWVELNARVFASHPEQGRITLDDLAAREAEPWFDADDFLMAWDGDRLVAYNWLKVESDDDESEEMIGEIYVIGVDSADAGRGLGRILMIAGLGRLRERGCAIAALYVDAENEGAVRLYRSLGFTDFTIDVQYRRRP